MPTCVINDCEKPTRSGKAELCKMHYHRQYRHGSTDKTWSNAPTVSAGRRYRVVTAHGHPLARAAGRVYEHRKVLFDTIGPGSHACHWCGRTVRWSTRGDVNGLLPDHVNGLGDDNRPENLVPACMSCNTARGLQAKAQAMREAGWWSNHDTIARLRAQPRRAVITGPVQPA